MAIDRYAVAACQTNLPNPRRRDQIARNVDRMLEMIDHAVQGYEPFFPVRLVVFPEFAISAPVYLEAEEILAKLAEPAPNEQTDRLLAKAREHGIWIQAGSLLEVAPEHPDLVFNTSLLIGPDGYLAKYRKVNPWIPFEVHASPHDLEGADPESFFPVTETPIGRLGAATCYDWLFPEVTRELARKGAEVLIRLSAYMDPWGATEPMDWWTVVNRCRALENMAYVVAANQGASLENYPPFSWPGGSQIVDYDGRLLATADPGPGEKIVVSPIDLASLRHARATRLGHNFLAHLRSEAYPGAARPGLPPDPAPATKTIDALKRRVAQRLPPLPEAPESP